MKIVSCSLSVHEPAEYSFRNLRLIAATKSFLWGFFRFLNANIFSRCLRQQDRSFKEWCTQTTQDHALPVYLAHLDAAWQWSFPWRVIQNSGVRVWQHCFLAMQFMAIPLSRGAMACGMNCPFELSNSTLELLWHASRNGTASNYCKAHVARRFVDWWFHAQHQDNDDDSRPQRRYFLQRVMRLTLDGHATQFCAKICANPGAVEP